MPYSMRSFVPSQWGKWFIKVSFFANSKNSLFEASKLRIGTFLSKESPLTFAEISFWHPKAPNDDTLQKIYYPYEIHILMYFLAEPRCIFDTLFFRSFKAAIIISVSIDFFRAVHLVCMGLSKRSYFIFVPQVGHVPSLCSFLFLLISSKSIVKAIAIAP